MPATRSRRQDGSLGSSWGNADPDYSDDNVSILSAGSASDAGSQSDYFEERTSGDFDDDNEDDMATPMPAPKRSQNVRASRGPSTSPRESRHSQHTPTQARGASRTSRPHMSGRRDSRDVSYPQMHAQQSTEPSFIMPAMDASSGFEGSPMRNSQMRNEMRSRTAGHNSQRRPSDTSVSSYSTNPRSKRMPPAPRRKGLQEEEAETLGQAVWTNVFWPIVKYMFDVFGTAMKNFVKPILGFIVGALLLVALIHFATVFLRNTISVALSPICMLPFSSSLIPLCNNGQIMPPRQPDFHALADVQTHFEDVWSAEAQTHALPANMKRTQVAIRDLRTQVKFSQLPSRAQLDVEFTHFIDTAREASDALARYNARIGFVMDQTISTNRWTLQVLHGISDLAAIDATPLARTLAALNPFSALGPPRETLEQKIFTQYTQHVSKVKDDVEALMQMSQSLIDVLRALDTRLDLINELIYRDDGTLKRSRDELLAQLWSRLGGNRGSKAAFETNLALLGKVAEYRAQAVDHVGKTLVTLQDIDAGLETLREGVAAPEIAGYGRGRPPLSMHIETVESCLERLREVRGEADVRERESVRNVMGGGSGSGRTGGDMRGIEGGRMRTVMAKSNQEDYGV